MTDVREILRLDSLGLNHSQIAASANVSRQTVVSILTKAKEADMNWAVTQSMPNKELNEVFGRASSAKPAYKMPDYEYVHREMSKSGVTLKLLWLEYCAACRDAGELHYQISQYKKYYHDHVIKTNATMHLDHKPGEVMEVDWAGSKCEIIDGDTGEIIKASIFVAVLPHSMYTYVEAFLDQKQTSWIAAHVHAFAYFNGVTRILVPDNLKTGVIKNTKEELALNTIYQEMAEHYGTAIIPTRVRKPKDKASVEGTVGKIDSFILAAIRNEKFFTLQELNAAIHTRLHQFNNEPFQKAKNSSRAKNFADEMPFLLPLPKHPYEVADTKVCTVQLNYHVLVLGQFYSVPFENIHKKVNVRITRDTIEILLDGVRICSHIRLYGREGQYSTHESHMPTKHQEHAKWTAERFRQWSAKIGSNTASVIECIITANKVEQQSYRACMALLKLSDQYTNERLENACTMALTLSTRPNYKIIQSILRSGQDKQIVKNADLTPEPQYSNVRGASYYRKGWED